MNPRRTPNTRITAALVAMVLVACGSSGRAGSPAASPATSRPASTDPPLIDKSGDPPTDVLTIRLVNENSDPGAEGEGLDAFVRLVGELSHGTIRVDLLPTGRLPSEQWDAQRGPDAHTRAVIEGKADLGFIGNNYWGLEGVTTTQAAQVPLLIRSTEQAVAVADDPALVHDLFAGLDDVGVVGLQMFPQNFKVLVSFDGPVHTAADLMGKVLQSRAGPELYDYFEALGTKPQQDTVGRQVYVAPTWIQPEWGEGVAVGNLPVYFVYFDLVANAAFWNGLTDDQRAILEQAAATAQDTVVDHLPENESAADMAAYCARGSTVEDLDAAGIASFETPATAEKDRLSADPTVADLITRIDALGKGTTPTTYTACGPDHQAPTSAFPDGTYRYEITESDLTAAGIEKDKWSADLGVYTVTMKNGDYQWTQQAPNGPAIEPGKGGYDGGGTYQAVGDVVTFVETVFDEPVTTKLNWSADADGSLHFVVVDATRDFPRFFFGEPWIRIGNA